MGTLAYRQSHREEARARTQAWREAHPDYKPNREVGLAATKRWQANHKEEVRAYRQRADVREHTRRVNRERYITDWAACQIKAIRHRCKKKGIPFELLAADIVVPEFCPILGIPLCIGNGKRHDGSPSVDRTDPMKGYVRGNVAVISDRANRIKNNGTAEEHRRIAAWLEARMAA